MSSRDASRHLFLLIPIFAMQLACDAKVSRYRITSRIAAGPDGFSSALYQATAHRLEPGNRVEFVNNGPVFDRLAAEIGLAKQSVNIVVFIWRPGIPSTRLVDALVERARAGVSCRVIVDAVGSLDFGELREQLVTAGCDVRIFRPLAQKVGLDRNHRKLFIIDGRLALTGGVGIYKSWLGDGRHQDQWRDSNVLVTGPAVHLMQQAFAENWQELDGPLLPPSDFPPLEFTGPTRATFVSSTGSLYLTKAERLMQLAIAAATQRLWITNPYFVPSPGIVELLLQKKREGVDVRVMAAGPTTDRIEVLREQRATYPALLAGGVRIWEYQPSLIHAKTLLVDDHLSVVGSINLDRLSLDVMEEGSMVMSDPVVAQQLEQAWEADVGFCKEILAH